MKTDQQIEDIIVEYRDHHTRITDLARTYRMSRQGIYKILHDHGIDTRKSRKVPIPCHVCGTDIPQYRCKARLKKKFFCSDKCFWAWQDVQKESYRPDNYHSRTGVKIVTALFPEFNPSVHSLHYIDGDREHNHRKNLEVYANQTDHLAVHSGVEVEPIWRGQ